MITVDLKWPPYLKAWLGWTKMFNLKIEISIFQPECSMPFGFHKKVRVALLLPLAVLFIGLIIYTAGQDWCVCASHLPPPSFVDNPEWLLCFKRCQKRCHKAIPQKTKAFKKLHLSLKLEADGGKRKRLTKADIKFKTISFFAGSLF